MEEELWKREVTNCEGYIYLHQIRSSKNHGRSRSIDKSSFRTAFSWCNFHINETIIMDLQIADVVSLSTGGSYSPMCVPFPQLEASFSHSNFSYQCNGSSSSSSRNLQSISSLVALHGHHSNVHPWWWNTESFLSQVLLYAVVGVVGGSLISAAHGLVEVFLYRLFDFLYRRGKIRRLAPSIPVTMNQYRVEDFWSVALWMMPLSTFLFYNRKVYGEKMKFSGDIVGCWLYAVTMMVLHDGYFYAVHTLMHRVKAVYRAVHSWHHWTGGNISVFSTAFGDVMDVAFTFGPFYYCVAYHVYRAPSWDPVAWFILLWALNGVDMMGHCAYDLPVCVYVPCSMGVLLFPFAQRTKHHFIHHLDPRFNRSLYFTWWDRLGGTFRDHHPKVVERRSEDIPRWKWWFGTL